MKNTINKQYSIKEIQEFAYLLGVDGEVLIYLPTIDKKLEIYITDESNVCGYNIAKGSAIKETWVDFLDEDIIASGRIVNDTNEEVDSSFFVMYIMYLISNEKNLVEILDKLY